MHKRRLNELTLHTVLEPAGPLLIKSGRESGADPTLPDMNFVRTYYPGTAERTIYLPGASLKGAIRSHVERVIRTVKGTGEKFEICCDPLDRNKACDRRITRLNITSTAHEYRELCLACRIFGHTVHASHFTIADAYPTKPINELPVRQGVAINRFSGGVGVGPFEMETAVGGLFHLQLRLHNFEVWQVGLLALALRDMAEGRLLLGFGKSRGFGKVNLFFTYLEVAYPGQFGAFDPTAALYGMSALAPDLQDDYGLVGADRFTLPAGGRLVAESAEWGRPAVAFGLDGPKADMGTPDASWQQAHTDITGALRAAVPAWAQYPETKAHV